MGFEVTMANSVRNAIRTIKKIKPQVVVAEFNFQSDFRDRTSSLESLLSTVQRLEQCEVIVFYEQEFAHQLEKLTAQYPINTVLSFPIEEANLKTALQNISNSE